MVCKECGTQLPDGAKFCYKCGKTIDASNDVVEDTTKALQEDSLEEKQDKVAEEDKVEDKKGEETVDEESSKESAEVSEGELDEPSDSEDELDEPSDSEDDADGEEEEVNKGFKIMINPDYVPPEVEEEKPFYEDHVNYEEIREQHAAKMEKRMQVLSVIIAIAVVLGVGAFFFFKFTSSQDYEEKLAQAEALFEDGDYEAAFLAFGELEKHGSADPEEMVMKQVDCLQAIGNNTRTRDFVILKVREYSSDEIRKLLDVITSTSTVPTNTPAPSDSPVASETPAPSDSPVASETPAPSDSPVASETPAPSDSPVVSETPAPSDSPVASETPTPTQTPDGEDAPMTDYTAYEDTFSKLAQAMSEVKDEKNISPVASVLVTEEYTKICEYKKDVYYAEGTISNKPIDGDGVMVVLANGYVYYGSVVNGSLSKEGILLGMDILEGVVKGYYMYKGQWENGYPNGTGMITKQDESGIKKRIGVTFEKGYYNGKMAEIQFLGNVQAGRVDFEVVAGVPVVLKDEAGNDIKKDNLVVVGYYVDKDGNKSEVTWDGVTKLCVEGLVY